MGKVLCKLLDAAVPREGGQPFRGRHGLVSARLATFDTPAPFSVLGAPSPRIGERLPTLAYPSRSLTTVAPKPSIEIEQATSSYSFRFSELSQPI